MAAANDKQESTRRIRPAALLGGIGRSTGSAPETKKSSDTLGDERLQAVEEYVACFPSDDEDRDRANRDLRGYARTQRAAG